jgi:hypothetical protein
MPAPKKHCSFCQDTNVVFTHTFIWNAKYDAPGMKTETHVLRSCEPHLPKLKEYLSSVHAPSVLDLVDQIQQALIEIADKKKANVQN